LRRKAPRRALLEDEAEMMTMKATMLAVCALLSAATPALAQKKSCDELKTEIEQKLQGKGVHDFTLEVMAAGDVKRAHKVVGTCEGGRKKVVYMKIITE
jgi:hypothetical protein